MTTNNEAVKSEEAAHWPLFTRLPTRLLLGNPHSPAPIGLRMAALSPDRPQTKLFACTSWVTISGVDLEASTGSRLSALGPHHVGLGRNHPSHTVIMPLLSAFRRILT